MPDSQEENITEHPGESDMVTFEVENPPERRYIIEEVSSPDIRWRYRHDERGDPTPEMFDRLGHIEVKLLGMSTDLEGEADDAAMRAYEALVDLREAMMDQRDLDADQRQKVIMGNLDGLPEVEKP